MLWLGAHMSVAGGLHNAIDDALSVESDAVQIFTKNQRQWVAKPIADEDAALFRQKFNDSGLKCVVAHNSYLINMASPKDDLWAKSVAAMQDELERCELLEVPYLVAHPGSHVGSGREVGLDRIVEALEQIHRALPGF
jgi:deoxyribonuclease IV